MWLIAAVQSIHPLGSGSVSSGHSAIGIALHVKLAIILMCSLEAESFVEPQSRVDFHDGQAPVAFKTASSVLRISQCRSHFVPRALKISTIANVCTSPE